MASVSLNTPNSLPGTDLQLNDNQNLNLVPTAQKTAVVVGSIPTELELQTVKYKLDKKIGFTKHFEAQTLFSRHTGGTVYLEAKASPLETALFEVYKAAAFINRVRDGKEQQEMSPRLLKAAFLSLNKRIELYHKTLKDSKPKPNQIGRVFQVLSEMTEASHYRNKSIGNQILNAFVNSRLAQAQELPNPKKQNKLPAELLYDTTKMDEAIALTKEPKAKVFKSSEDRVSRCSLSTILQAGLILAATLSAGVLIQTAHNIRLHPDSLNICQDSERANATAAQYANLPVCPLADSPIDPIPVSVEPWYEEQAPSILSNLGLYGLALTPLAWMRVNSNP